MSNFDLLLELGLILSRLITLAFALGCIIKGEYQLGILLGILFQLEKMTALMEDK